MGGWSLRGDSNPRPTVYETVALPLSYAGQTHGCATLIVSQKRSAAETPTAAALLGVGEVDGV